MNEDQEARKFSEELDALLENGETSSKDPALAAARRLAKADFSAQSRVRESLRARLLKEGAPAPWPPLRFAAAAACLALALGLGKVFWRQVPAAHAPLPFLPPRMEARAPAVPETPFRAIPHKEVFATAQAREVRQDGVRLVVWELEGGSISLETRRITLEDIFRTPSL
ncbi:MAG TPA: hypothetical protein DCM05_10155 [Elusimicrobia bacterium]|nr:hypothetical protein [Elusimicrobiota bacterium]